MSSEKQKSPSLFLSLTSSLFSFSLFYFPRFSFLSLSLLLLPFSNSLSFSSLLFSLPLSLFYFSPFLSLSHFFISRFFIFTNVTKNIFADRVGVLLNFFIIIIASFSLTEIFHFKKKSRIR